MSSSSQSSDEKSQFPRSVVLNPRCMRIRGNPTIPASAVGGTKFYVLSDPGVWSHNANVMGVYNWVVKSLCKTEGVSVISTKEAASRRIPILPFQSWDLIAPGVKSYLVFSAWEKWIADNGGVRASRSGALSATQKAILAKVRGETANRTTHGGLWQRFDGWSIWLNIGAISAAMIVDRSWLSSDEKRGLLWREMYLHCEHHGHVNEKGAGRLIWDGIVGAVPPVRISTWNLRPIDWAKRPAAGTADLKKFNSWKNGKTGVGIVDACMTQLQKTGMLSNRGRMIAASYLISDLELDWRFGEAVFANWLRDYDPVQNLYNWCWMYRNRHYRALSAEAQQRKFDPKKEFRADCF